MIVWFLVDKNITKSGLAIFDQSSPAYHMIQGLVLRLRLWDLLCWMLAVNSTVLSDGPGLKHFNFEFRILHGPRQPVVKDATGRLSAVLLPTNCLHSTEFSTRQENHRVNISTI